MITTVKANLLDAHRFGFKFYPAGMLRWIHVSLAVYLCITALNAAHYDYPYAYSFLFFILLTLPISFLFKTVILRKNENNLEVVIESRLAGFRLRSKTHELCSINNLTVEKQGKHHNVISDNQTNITVHLGRVRNAELDQFKAWLY